MTEDIEECLQVVIQTLKRCDLPTGEVMVWCEAMLKSDCAGCMCDQELRVLQHQFKGARS